MVFLGIKTNYLKTNMALYGYIFINIRKELVLSFHTMGEAETKWSYHICTTA